LYAGFTHGHIREVGQCSHPLGPVILRIPITTIPDTHIITTAEIRIMSAALFAGVSDTIVRYSDAEIGSRGQA
jgi:hypothetical protein